jgi:hypothetical protein
MNLKLLFSGLLITASAFCPLSAQEWEHLTVASGYNQDVIANGLGAANTSTTIGVDNANFAFMSNDFQALASNTPPAYALPATGLISSLPTPGLTYQLGSYSSNNSLRIGGSESGSPITGTLTFTNQVSAKKLYLLTTSGSGTATVSIVINFTDATSQTITGSTIPDWYNSTALPVAASGFGRVNRANSVLENPSGNPRMYQLALNIETSNQPKLISSIVVNKTSATEGAINVFAVTAELLGTCPAPDGLTAASGVNSATVNWNPAIIAPANGYDYYYATTSAPPTALTEPTGSVAAGVTSVALNELLTGQTYYFWVRSNCSESDQGPWVMTSFTTGQVSATYTDGDIQTLYNASPNANSTTSCPGVLTVTIPDGYQATSVATSYSMTSASNGYMSEQRSKLHCINTNTGETTLAQGSGNVGTFNYNRSGLNIADGATGEVNFEMRAWRTWQGAGTCNTTYNKVNNYTWVVTVTYECVTPLTPQAADQAHCPGSTVADLVAEIDYDNAVLRWYDSELATEPLEASAVIASGTYYVSQYRYTCESERQAVVVTVGTPEAPTAAAQDLCSGAVVADLSAEATEGATLIWYPSADATEPLAESAEAVSGSYFVAQAVNGCESSRTEVAVTVTTVSAPDAEAQLACVGTTLSQLDVEADENAALIWYAGADTPDPLSGDAEVQAGSYYVSQTINGCESERVEVTVAVINLPEPVVVAAQTVCEGTELSELMATPLEGAELYWYATAEATEELDDDEEVQGGSYFVSQAAEGCESARVEIVVTVNPLPEAPEGEATQEFNEGETIESLEVTLTDGAVANWYMMNDESELVAVDPNEALVDGGVYYVSQTIEGCESDYLVITASAAMSIGTTNGKNFKLYPNPATNMVTLSGNGIIAKAEIVNLLGQTVKAVDAGTEELLLDVADLQVGTYVVNVYSDKGTVTSVKLLKQ